MSTTSCALGCTQRHSKSSDVRFCRFPNDEERRKKWIISMKRMQADTLNGLGEPSYYDRMCSLHFISGKYNLILHLSLFYLNSGGVEVAIARRGREKQSRYAAHVTDSLRPFRLLLCGSSNLIPSTINLLLKRSCDTLSKEEKYVKLVVS
uniref:THAP domain-containing protein 1 n=1 Tax=Fundulus heteroclitus TaxID=8078 RepID=A0A3Q2Q1M1_FUNHE